MDLAHYDDIRKWDPQIGDFIVWHGWFQHYFGVISSISREDQSVIIIKRGLPIMLFDMVSEEHEKNKIKVSIGSIKGSRGGKYATIRAQGNNVVWYV
jgi:hypothetical protein